MRKNWHVVRCACTCAVMRTKRFRTRKDAVCCSATAEPDAVLRAVMRVSRFLNQVLDSICVAFPDAGARNFSVHQRLYSTMHAIRHASTQIPGDSYIKGSLQNFKLGSGAGSLEARNDGIRFRNKDKIELGISPRHCFTPGANRLDRLAVSVVACAQSTDRQTP